MNEEEENVKKETFDRPEERKRKDRPIKCCLLLHFFFSFKLWHTFSLNERKKPEHFSFIFYYKRRMKETLSAQGRASSYGREGQEARLSSFLQRIELVANKKERKNDNSGHFFSLSF